MDIGTVLAVDKISYFVGRRCALLVKCTVQYSDELHLKIALRLSN